MKRTVLVVTNSALTREVLVEPLEDHGCEVLVAEDTWEAVGMCAGHGVDVVVMDLDWPGDESWDGWEMIKGTLGAKRRLPIVIITGRLDLKEAARAAGARGLAGKPLDVGALVELVEDLLSERIEIGANGPPQVRDFKHVPANGNALRVAIMDRVRRPFVTAEHNRHWGLNE